MFNNVGPQKNEQKIKAVQEFLQSLDKQRTGQVSVANFQKVMRVFGIQAQIPTEAGEMIDYERILADL